MEVFQWSHGMIERFACCVANLSEYWQICDKCDGDISACNCLCEVKLSPGSQV